MKQLLADPVLIAVAVLNHNDGGPFVKEAIKRGLKGGIISPATGLIGSHLLNLLSIRHDRRDVVLMFERQSHLIPVLEELVAKFKMDLPNHGIIFLSQVKFALRREASLNENKWNETDAEYQLILTVCKHGRAPEVVNKINQVSSAGATVFTGKGDHHLERQQMMGLSFSPQKDIIMMVAKSDEVPDIFQILEDYYACSQTKGMFSYSLELQSFSQEKRKVNKASKTPKELLVSIVSEDLEENYVEMMKKHQMNGGTSLNGYGSVSPEMMERIFNISVNPQKKILFTVDVADKIERAYHDILLDKSLNGKHQGIFLTLPIIKTYGLYQAENKA